jgi:murein DD-endopeptidase MepM/ murein hydrolase activator NlpD
MKPLSWILPVVLATPAIVPLVAAVADDARGSNPTDLLIASLPAIKPPTVWVKVKQSTTIEELSSQLRLDETQLAKLNRVDEDHRFNPGDLLALPANQSVPLDRIASLDPNGTRLAHPLPSAPPPSVGAGVVRFGDTLLLIAQRYGLTLAELLRLNPGLETARLVVGSQVQLAQSAPNIRSRMLLGMNPVGSGGVSWPELPNFGPQQRPFRGHGSTAPLIWPTRGTFTSGYGWRWGRMHKGIDVANNVGTPIVAALEGQVSFAGWDDGGYGYLVKILHADGSVTLYGHNSRILVSQGQFVQQGQPISQMGSTGRSTGPHLHFEVRPAGQGAINPLNVLPPRA